MIVIKCNDCGNILNPGDKVCSKCGCPVENNNKRVCATCGNELNDFEGTCSKCLDNKKLYGIIKTNREKSLKVLFKICDILSVIFVAVALFCSIFMVFLLPIFIVFALINFYLLKLFKEHAVKSFISLKDDELYGEFYALFKVNKISFPLNKISSIRNIKIFGIINILSIVADSGKVVRFFLVDNADEFREVFANQLAK